MVCLLWLFGSYASAQSVSQGHKSFEPFIWLKHEPNATISDRFTDFSGNSHHVLLDSAKNIPDSVGFNFNPAYSFAQNTSPFIIYNASVYAKGVTIFAVYEVDTPNLELSVYQIQSTDSSFVRLTNKRLFDNRTVIQITDTAAIEPIVNVVSKQLGKHRFGKLDVNIILGGDSTSMLEGKIAEFILFNERLSQLKRLKCESYLALKYGITLPASNYVTSKDSVIWKHKDNKNFQFGMAAIGVDSLFQLNQKQAAAYGGKDVVTMAAGSLAPSNYLNATSLKEGDFLIWGHTKTDLGNLRNDTIGVDSVVLELRRTWKMVVHGDSANTLSTQLVFDGTSFENLADPYLKIWSGDVSNMDQSRVVFPDSTDQNNKYYFSNLKWDEDDEGFDFFTFGFQTDMNQPILRNSISPMTNGNMQTHQSTAGISVSNAEGEQIVTKVFPNPSNGEFTIHIKADPQEKLFALCIDMLGRVLYTRELAGSATYDITDFKVAAGHYSLVVTSGTGATHTVNRIVIY